MATLETAVAIAAKAHADTKDKQGMPYLLHPLQVMARVSTLDAMIVAVLHDVIEDTSVTLDDIRKAGFSEEVVEALRLVTHAAADSYADYVVRIKQNPIAVQVKLADLAENCRLDRSMIRPDKIDRDLQRVHRYLFTYRYLTDGLTETQYRALMAAHG